VCPLISCLPYRRVRKRATRNERPDVDDKDGTTTVGVSNVKAKIYRFYFTVEVFIVLP
jgi:hypothetical protein